MLIHIYKLHLAAHQERQIVNTQMNQPCTGIYLCITVSGAKDTTLKRTRIVFKSFFSFLLMPCMCRDEPTTFAGALYVSLLVCHRVPVCLYSGRSQSVRGNKRLSFSMSRIASVVKASDYAETTEQCRRAELADDNARVKDERDVRGMLSFLFF